MALTLNRLDKLETSHFIYFFNPPVLPYMLPNHDGDHFRKYGHYYGEESNISPRSMHLLYQLFKEVARCKKQYEQYVLRLLHLSILLSFPEDEPIV